MAEAETLQLPGTEPTAEELATRQPSAELTPHDQRLQVRALEKEAGRLEKLSATNQKEGYPRAALEQRNDMRSIKERILPTLDDQAEIPLATFAEVSAGIANQIKSIILQGRSRKDNDHELADRIARRVEQYCTGVWERGFEAGQHMREHDPKIAMISGLRDLWSETDEALSEI